MDELIIKAREFKDELEDKINQLLKIGMPALALTPIVKTFYEQLNNIEEQQYKQALISQKSKEINEENKKKKEEEKKEEKK